MKTQKEVLQMPRLQVEWTSHDGGAGMIYLNGIRQKPASIVWSFGGGWDHVSIAYPNRCPTWEEMCQVKEAFFHDDETVIQFHPKKSEYINKHPYCLHLWRKQGEEAELPPQIFV